MPNCICPLRFVFDKFTSSQFARFTGNAVRLIYVQVEEGADMEEVMLQIELKLAASKDLPVEELPYNLQTQQDIVNTQSGDHGSISQSAGLGWQVYRCWLVALAL